MRNTVSKQPVALRSSASVNQHLFKLPFAKSGSFLFADGLLLSSPSGCPCPHGRASGDILRHEVPKALRPSCSSVQQALISIYSNCRSPRAAVFYLPTGCFCHPRAVARARTGERVGTSGATKKPPFVMNGGF